MFRLNLLSVIEIYYMRTMFPMSKLHLEHCSIKRRLENSSLHNTGLGLIAVKVTVIVKRERHNNIENYFS